MPIGADQAAKFRAAMGAGEGTIEMQLHSPITNPEELKKLINDEIEKRENKITINNPIGDKMETNEKTTDVKVDVGKEREEARKNELARIREINNLANDYGDKIKECKEKAHEYLNDDNKTARDFKDWITDRIIEQSNDNIGLAVMERINP